MMTVPEAELVLNGGIIWVVVSNKISGSTATRVDDAVLTELAACAKSLPMRVGELHLCTSYNEESPTRDKLTHLVSASSNIITHIHKGKFPEAFFREESDGMIWNFSKLNPFVSCPRIASYLDSTSCERWCSCSTDCSFD